MHRPRVVIEQERFLGKIGHMIDFTADYDVEVKITQKRLNVTFWFASTFSSANLFTHPKMGVIYFILYCVLIHNNYELLKLFKFGFEGWTPLLLCVCCNRQNERVCLKIPIRTSRRTTGPSVLSSVVRIVRVNTKPSGFARRSGR